MIWVAAACAVVVLLFVQAAWHLSRAAPDPVEAAREWWKRPS